MGTIWQYRTESSTQDFEHTCKKIHSTIGDQDKIWGLKIYCHTCLRLNWMTNGYGQVYEVWSTKDVIWNFGIMLLIVTFARQKFWGVLTKSKHQIEYNYISSIHFSEPPEQYGIR